MPGDQAREVEVAGAAVKLAKATNTALDQIELDPGIGSPTLGKLIGIPGLRTWRVAKFPRLWCYLERRHQLDVVRLLARAKTLQRSWAISLFERPDTHR